MIQQRDLGDESDRGQMRGAVVQVYPLCPICGCMVPKDFEGVDIHWHTVTCQMPGCGQVVSARFYVVQS